MPPTKMKALRGPLVRPAQRRGAWMRLVFLVVLMGCTLVVGAVLLGVAIARQ